MEKNQSSVEWFAKKVKNHCDRTGEAPSYHQIGEWQKEAKVRHGKEIKKAWEEGFSFSSPYQSAEIYYNETYETAPQPRT